MHTSGEETVPIGTKPNDHNSDSRVFDLGNGVKVFPARAETWVVESRLLGFPWKRRQEGFPGTAVEWREQLMEVVDADEDGHRFLLAPWPQEEALRNAFSLDSGWIQSFVGETASSDRARRIRALLVGLLPFTGLLPRTIQMRLEQDFNLPACRATMISSLLEIPIGGAGIFQTFLLMTGGGWILPPGLRWTMFIAPFLFAEALFRLNFTFCHGEPIGSFLLSPLNLLMPKPVTDIQAEDLRAFPVAWDPEAKELVLKVKEPRSDWYEDGILCFHGRKFQLEGRVAQRHEIHYRFRAVSDDAEVTLRLAPPPRETKTQPPTQAPGPLSLAFKNCLFAFAPARYQKTWFRRHGGSALLFTVFAASLETFAGGLGVLTRPATGFLGLVDLLTLGDGLFRLGSALVNRGPVGSVFGLPFHSLFRRWTQTKLL